MANDFLEMYLQYTADTEATATFHRWAAIVGVGAYLERNIWIQHGAMQHFPNHYVMLLGESGSRKSAAIKGFVRILKEAGYKTLAAEKTSKEKFSQDLAAMHSASTSDDSLAEEMIFGASANEGAITPVLIANDEANDFFGFNNIEFLSLLGSWWDYHGIYEVKYKTSKSDAIPNPTPSILVGNTPTNFSLAFPPTIIGQGFFSRILLIHGERTRGKITWPTPPPVEDAAAVVAALGEIKKRAGGCMNPVNGAKKLVDHIYHQPEYIADERFASYYNRRLTHLLKLSLVVAACKFEKEITEDTIIQANTYLTYIQNLMPKALGEYGRSMDSAITQKIMTFIQRSSKPVTMKELAKQVANDVQNLTSLRQIIEKLTAADKIMLTQHGMIPIHQGLSESLSEKEHEFIDFDRYLTKEELGVRT